MDRDNHTLHDEDVVPFDYDSTSDDESDEDSDEEDESPPLKPRPIKDDNNDDDDDDSIKESMGRRSYSSNHAKTRSEKHMETSMEQHAGATTPTNDIDKKSSRKTNGAEKRSEQPELEVRKRYNLRSNRRRSYGHCLDHVMDNNEGGTKRYGLQFLQFATDTSYDLHVQHKQWREKAQKSGTNSSLTTAEPKLLRAAVDDAHAGATGKLLEYVTKYMFTQMTADAGIKKHGVAVDALIKEFAQLHDKKVFEGLHPKALSADEKKDSLPSINLIKEKRDGKIKGQSVADGQKQHKMFSKDQITSPTVSTDALLMTLIIDAMEEQEVGTADVPGAYLQANMEDCVILKMTGQSVDALCKTDDSYKEFVMTEQGKKVIYLRLKKALYGCIKSAMLWYNLFTENLAEIGFKINLYDTCVANKVINGKQCTIVWYVDDLKVSHVEQKVVLILIIIIRIIIIIITHGL